MTRKLGLTLSCLFLCISSVLAFGYRKDTADSIHANTGQFDGILTESDNTVQKALDLIDDTVVSTSTLNSALNEIAVSTANLQNQVNDLIISTGILQGHIEDIIVSTGNLQGQIDNLAVSTGSLQNQINTINLSTGNWTDAYDKRVDTWGDGLKYSSNQADIDFNSANMKITAEQINTIQDIDINSTPRFAQITIDNTPVNDSDAATKNYVDLLLQGLDWQESVKDEINFTVSEPTTVINGDRYINTTTGNSSNTGQPVIEDYIYEWNGSSWTETSVSEGFAVWVENSDTQKVYNSSDWVRLGSTIIHNNLSNKQGGSGSDEFYHLNQSAYSNLYQQDQSVLTGSEVTFNTLDTGQGANELYDMDQNVLTTSNVDFATATIANTLSASVIDCTEVKVDTISTHSPLYINNNANNVLFTGSGNVAIGTTTATDKLYVQGTVNGTYINARDVLYTHGYLKFTSANGYAGDSAIIGLDNTTGAGKEIMFYDYNASNPLLVIEDSGKVGIGHINPQTKLHIKGNANIEDSSLSFAQSSYNGLLHLYASNLSGFTPALYIENNGGGNIGKGTGLMMSCRSNLFKSGIAFVDIDTYGRGSMRFLMDNTADSSHANLSDEVMRINSNGNIGIGENSPSEKLDIAGNCNIQGNLFFEGNAIKEIRGPNDSGDGGFTIHASRTRYKGAALYFRTAGDTIADWQGNIAFAFGDYTAPAPAGAKARIRYLNNGSVDDVILINPTTFTSKLNIIPSSDNTYSLGSPTNRWKEVYVSSTSLHIGEKILSVQNGELDFDGKTISVEMDPKVGTISNNYMPKWNGSQLVTGTIIDDGNIGIGTATPAEKLEVDGNIRLSRTGDRTIGITDANTTGRSLTIKAGGNINSTSIAYAGGELILKAGHCNKSAGAEGDYPPNVNSVKIYAGENTFGGVAGTSWNGDIIMYAGHNLPERFRLVGNSGNVGIGTSTPARRLFVNGSAGGTTGWYNDSDERLKKDIKTISNALEKISQLRGVEFYWKDTTSHPDKKQIGLIAQEVIDIVPEVVDKPKEYYSIEYAQLVSLLIEGIKELNNRIDELEAQIKEVK